MIHPSVVSRKECHSCAISSSFEVTEFLCTTRGRLCYILPMPAKTTSNGVSVIFFDDMRGSTALKEAMAESSDEQAFQDLRLEHDALVSEVITRDGAGHVIKSTGDGLLAVFLRPSVAVERSLEIQERLHAHPHLNVRIGLDMGEVRIESTGSVITDVFGRHVDWAARATALTDGGHICVTRAVYMDAYSWLTKTRIAWLEHGFYRLKDGEPPLDLFEPYNANVTEPLERLNGTQEMSPYKVSISPVEDSPQSNLRLIHPWEAVARDGREFAETGAGTMYWFKVPLGGVSYSEGFRSFLVPALANPRISKVRFVLDSSSPVHGHVWSDRVLPLLEEWAAKEGREFLVEQRDDGGRFHEPASGKVVEWLLVDLAGEFTPCFKLFVQDPDNDVHVHPEAQIFLSTAARTVRMSDGKLQAVRIPDAILRVSINDDEALIHALNSVSNQWDALFS